MCWSSCSNNILTCMCSLVMQYYLDPPLRLREALEQKGLKPDCFFTLHHGESRLISAQDEDVFDWCAVFLWPVSMDLSVTKCSKFIACRICFFFKKSCDNCICICSLYQLEIKTRPQYWMFALPSHGHW